MMSFSKPTQNHTPSPDPIVAVGQATGEVVNTYSFFGIEGKEVVGVGVWGGREDRFLKKKIVYIRDTKFRTF